MGHCTVFVVMIFPQLSSLSGTPSFLLFCPHRLKLLAVLYFQLTDSPLNISAWLSHMHVKPSIAKRRFLTSPLNPPLPSLPFLSRHHDQEESSHRNINQVLCLKSFATYPLLLQDRPCLPVAHLQNRYKCLPSGTFHSRLQGCGGQ